jgi:uncharacterized protein YbcI
MVPAGTRYRGGVAAGFRPSLACGTAIGGRERRLAVTAAPDPPNAEMLGSVTEAMIALHERYHHRTPVTGKTQLLGDDLLVCVLGGVYTDVEKTMIELQRSTVVQETRSAFQTAMQQRFIDQVERLTGRRVLAFISNQHVGPDLEVEIFMLAPAS